jgi:hypothetical protein
MRNDQAMLFGAEVCFIQCVVCLLIALGCTLAALFLDLFDAPLLAAGEFAFGHAVWVRSVGDKAEIGLV